MELWVQIQGSMKKMAGQNKDILKNCNCLFQRNQSNSVKAKFASYSDPKYLNCRLEYDFYT